MQSRKIFHCFHGKNNLFSNKYEKHFPKYVLQKYQIIPRYSNWSHADNYVISVTIALGLGSLFAESFSIAENYARKTS